MTGSTEKSKASGGCGILRRKAPSEEAAVSRPERNELAGWGSSVSAAGNSKWVFPLGLFPCQALGRTVVRTEGYYEKHWTQCLMQDNAQQT